MLFNPFYNLFDLVLKNQRKEKISILLFILDQTLKFLNHVNLIYLYLVISLLHARNDGYSHVQ